MTGPVIGTNRYGTIGDRDVVVPDSFFKAVLAYKGGKYHSIAFMMDNDDKRYWLDDCAMTVNDLESVTGLGLMIGIKTKKPAREVVNACIEKGVLCLTAKDRVRLLPALNIPMDLLEQAVAALKEACR